MLDLRFGQPQDKYQPCSRCVSTILELSFDHTRSTFRLCSCYDSIMLVVCTTVLVVCFDYARGMFQPYSSHNLTVLELSRHSSDISTVLDRVTIVLVVCFHCARDMFRLCSGYVSTVLGYVSTVLVVSFGHARFTFRSTSR